MLLTIDLSGKDRGPSDRRVFIEYSWAPILALGTTVTLAVILGTACWHESTVVREGDSLNVSIGGPITRTAFLAIAIYAVVCGSLVWPGMRERRRLDRALSPQDLQFIAFTDDGFELGLRGLWKTERAWSMVAEVRLSRDDLFVLTPGAMVNVDTGRLDDAEYEELRAYFLATREVIEPANFFGWRWKSWKERTTFGRLKPTAITPST